MNNLKFANMKNGKYRIATRTTKNANKKWVNVKLLLYSPIISPHFISYVYSPYSYKVALPLSFPGISSQYAIPILL